MHIFISYAKADTYNLTIRLREALSKLDSITVWMDETLTPGRAWALQIQAEIRRSDVVIVLLSPDVNRDPDGEKGISFVINEIEYAQSLRKLIIPIMAQRTERPIQIVSLQYIDFTNNHKLGLERLIQEITKQAGIVVPESRSARNSVSSHLLTHYWFYSLTSLLVIFVAAFLLIRAKNDVSLSDSYTPTQNSVEFGKNWTGTFYSNSELAGKGTTVSGIDGLNFNWGTGSPLINGVAVPIISPSSFSARFTSNQLFQDGIYTFIASSDGGMRLYIDGTIFLDKYIDRPLTTDTRGNIKISAGMHNLTVEYGKFAEQAILQVQWVLTDIGADNTTFSTATPYVFSNISPSQEKLILKGVQTNQEWNIVVKQFNDVDMVLVPVGCFMMGNNDERTDRHQCVQKPFWLDRYEITNGQYGSSGYFKGYDHPRDSITWVNAREFCNKSDGRLPTELEWEFAARGPDNLIYPWGNNFIPDNATYNDNARGETSTIGRRLGGMSWVGAEDMSGNVFEWTSSMMLPYPYSSNDGREDSNDLTTDRINRGGSWLYHADLLPSWYRRANEPNDPNKVRSDLGFRCARDFTPSDLPS